MPQDAGNLNSAFGLAVLNGKQTDLGYFVTQLTPVAFSIATVMLMIYFIIAAFELITSQGDKAHIVSARSKIYHSIIGFILLIVLFLVLRYIIPALGVTGLNII